MSATTIGDRLIRPPSKTAFYSLANPIAKIPIIHVIRVAVESAPNHTNDQNPDLNATAQPVVSHALRRQAIEEWLRNMFHIERFSDTYAGKLANKRSKGKDGKEGKFLDQVLIILYNSTKDGYSWQNMIQAVLNTFARVVRAKKTVRTASKGLHYYRLTCEYQRPWLYSTATEDDYWEKLQIILHQQLPSRGIDHGIYDKSGAVLVEALEGPPSDQLRYFPFQPASKFCPELSAFIRARGSIGAKDGTMVHNVELDLAPGVQKGKNLADVFHRIFGCASQYFLTAVRKVLVGLEVQKLYDTPGCSGPTKSRPVFMIRDVESPGKVHSFQHGQK